jgi:putative flippase GtrA
MTKGLGKYLLVGVGSNLLNYVIYFICYKVEAPLYLASLAGYSGGMLFSYHFGRTWVFDFRFNVTKKNLIRFLSVYIAGGVGMSLLIEAMHELPGFDYQLSWIFGAIFAVINNFLGLKFFVFKKD